MAFNYFILPNRNEFSMARAHSNNHLIFFFIKVNITISKVTRNGNEKLF